MRPSTTAASAAAAAAALEEPEGALQDSVASLVSFLPGHCGLSDCACLSGWALPLPYSHAGSTEADQDS